MNGLPKMPAVTYPVTAMVYDPCEDGVLHLQALTKGATPHYIWPGRGLVVEAGDHQAWDRLLSPKGLIRRTEWRQEHDYWVTYCDKPGGAR